MEFVEVDPDDDYDIYVEAVDLEAALGHYEYVQRQGPTIQFDNYLPSIYQGWTVDIIRRATMHECGHWMHYQHSDDPTADPTAIMNPNLTALEFNEKEIAMLVRRFGAPKWLSFDLR